MRLIDSDKLKEEVLKWLPADPCGREKMERSYQTDITVSMMQTIEEAETVDAIPLDWIRGYIETCDMFQLCVNVPASKIISVMVNTWKRENPGAKRGGTDAVNN